MKQTVKDIIKQLQPTNNWLNLNHTRDRLLIGDENQTVNRILVCWVATNKIIDYAQKNQFEMIVSHENPFYLSSTNLPTCLYNAIIEKKKKMETSHLSLYRCHDLWDLYPEYGVRDIWANMLHIPLEKPTNSFHRYSIIGNYQLEDIIKKLLHSIYPYGESGIELVGDINQEVHKIGFGTGAVTNVFEMYDNHADCMIVSNDGINTWQAIQWANDYHIPLIIVNHYTSEAAGIESLSHYIQDKNKNLYVEYKINNFKIQHINHPELNQNNKI